MPWLSRRGARAVRWYYAPVLAVSLVVFTPLASWLGETGAWLRAANEVFLIALFVPAYWDLVATDPRAADTRAWQGRDRWRVRVAWYGLLLGGLVLMEGPLLQAITGTRLPQSLLTLRDAWLGIVVLTAWFDVSRRFMLGDGKGRELLSGPVRGAYYFAVALVNILIFQDPVRTMLGPDLFSTLDFHAEAFATALLVPVYFDVVLPMTGGDPRLARRTRSPMRRWILLAWVLSCIALSILGQGPALALVPNALGQWLVRSAEAPLGALLVTLYVEVFRWAGPSRGRAIVHPG